jgi:hypothetical protein
LAPNRDGHRLGLIDLNFLQRLPILIAQGDKDNGKAGSWAQFDWQTAETDTLWRLAELIQNSDFIEISYFRSDYPI